MKYRELGRTGVLVSETRWGTDFRNQGDESECVRIIEHALALGRNFVDTTPCGGGHSEKGVGRAIKGKRNEMVLTTKNYTLPGDDPNGVRYDRLTLMRGLKTASAACRPTTSTSITAARIRSEYAG